MKRKKIAVFITNIGYKISPLSSTVLPLPHPSTPHQPPRHTHRAILNTAPWVIPPSDHVSPLLYDDTDARQRLPISLRVNVNKNPHTCIFWSYPRTSSLTVLLALTQLQPYRLPGSSLRGPPQGSLLLVSSCLCSNAPFPWPSDLILQPFPACLMFFHSTNHPRTYSIFYFLIYCLFFSF